jgi:O-antigen/teichoic acid export membrane protein
MISFDRLLNVGLRAVTLIARFLLIFFLARHLDPASVGTFGLLAAAIGYALYFVGLDFYTFTTREVLKSKSDSRGALLKNQIVLSAILYTAIIPIIFVANQNGLLPEGLFFWFAALLLLEYINQEISRLLVALSEQIAASIILFFRQGSWAIGVATLLALSPSNRNIEFVLASWLIAGLVAASIGIAKVSKLGMGGWHNRIDWIWIRSGLKICMPFLLATLAFRATQTADRYWLESLAGIEVVGAYVLFIGVAGTLMAFLEAGVFAFSYPTLIKLYQGRDHVAFRCEVRRMLFATLISSASFAMISMMLLPIMLNWIHKPFYAQYQFLFPWLLGASILNVLGMVSHYALYAEGQDRPIIQSHVGGLLVFLLITFLAGSYWPLLAVPIGLNASFAAIFVWKSVAYLMSKPSAESGTPPQALA